MNPFTLVTTRTHALLGPILGSTKSIVCCGAMVLGVPLAHAQQVDYILDTGVGTFNIGPSQFDANMTWLNSFDTIEGGEVITTISVSFGDIADNDGNIGSDLVTVAILKDPNNDHDPADAILLSTMQVQWVDTGFGEFVNYPIEPTQIEGVFFVAVMMDVLQRSNTASMDPNSPTAGSQSWLFYNPKPNLEDLGSSPFILRMGDSPFLGAWMIRAIGESVCAGDFTGDGELNFFDVSAFLILFSSQDPAADLNADGELNFFDVSLFLNYFVTGCP
ncbi:MAG: hypothetical protein JKX70_01800 [Phycisphaerales bacterium]|nr:hypothetical protein [Phycisphaerales bacterium]